MTTNLGTTNELLKASSSPNKQIKVQKCSFVFIGVISILGIRVTTSLLCKFVYSFTGGRAGKYITLDFYYESNICNSFTSNKKAHIYQKLDF